LGYLDKIDRADIFVLLDNVQYKKNEWQNRNKIKTAQGWQWLTVPVKYKYPQSINEVTINTAVNWQHKHQQAIKTNYAKAPHKNYLDDFCANIFSGSWEMIAQLNIQVVKSLVEALGMDTPVFVASELEAFPEDPDERLIAITRYFEADTYLAGNGGSQYMDLRKYYKQGIELVFQDYKHPVYRQPYGAFEPYMSVVDLILNHGDESLNVLRGKNV
jgi:hypothetical protein